MHEPDVTIADDAARRIATLLAEQPDTPEGAGLRIDVVPGGCSGHQYRLALDTPADDDVVLERGGVRLIVGSDALPFVRGARLRADAAGFHVDNPNVVYGCGCGSSFELAEAAAGPA